jgi:multidrug transporter EmrE-like cation transporter
MDHRGSSSGRLRFAPLAFVSALREPGIVFAVIIDVVILKEPISIFRSVSIATMLLGTTILKLAR